jgi:hypothetical protein
MRGELLACREAKQRDIYLLILVQDAAQDSIFWWCELLVQICKKCVVHRFLLHVRPMWFGVVADGTIEAGLHLIKIVG